MFLCQSQRSQRSLASLCRVARTGRPLVRHASTFEHASCRRHHVKQNSAAIPHCGKQCPRLSTHPRDGNVHTQTSNRALYSSMEKEEPAIQSFFENQTGTWQYVVADPSTQTAVIIDPVLNYDPATHTVTTSSAETLLSWVQKKNLKVEKILETHVHADHLTAAAFLQSRLASTQGYRPLIGIGKRIGTVQKLFGHRYGINQDEYEAAFDILFDDDEPFTIGNLTAVAIHLPGHTPDHLGYKIGDNVFSGDSIFHTDIGTARCDFPGGSENSLFDSGRKLLDMPPHVKIWMGHDYPAGDRSTPVPYMTVQEHQTENRHLKEGVKREDFVALRKERDATLAAPRLLHQSLQINIRAGRLPKENDAGYQLLHLPLKSHNVKW